MPPVVRLLHHCVSVIRFPRLCQMATLRLQKETLAKYAPSRYTQALTSLVCVVQQCRSALSRWGLVAAEHIPRPWSRKELVVPTIAAAKVGSPLATATIPAEALIYAVTAAELASELRLEGEINRLYGCANTAHRS